MLESNFFNLDELENSGGGLSNGIKFMETGTHEMAIVGMTGTLPLAPDLETYWANLRGGRDCIHPLPADRRQDATHYLRFKGWTEEQIKYLNFAFVHDIDKFDYRYFNMTPREASLTDPVQRLFMQSVMHTLEEGGYGGSKLSGSRTGVYFGHSELAEHKYKQILSDVDNDSIIEGFMGNLTSVIPSRVAYLMDWHGPSLCVDTSCSSSLVALHLACQAIRNGECDQAVVGTVRLNLLPVNTKHRLGIESSDGRTKSFEDSSNGTGSGEGVMSMLIKPLHKALRDGDHIHAVIKGSAVNQDGHSIGLSAPNSAAQEDCLSRAWDDAGIHPDTLSYLEAHGTGTTLGDPIEIDGIQRAVSRYTNRKQFLSVGSVKSNLGHLENAAGLAGLFKCVLALQHREIPPTIHFRRPNRRIPFEDSPVYVSDRLHPWEASADHPRRCSVSSFGMSGTNTHVVLEEAPETGDRSLVSSSGPFVFTVTAKSQTALSALLASYRERLGRANGMELGDICYTVNTGRKHHPRRFLILAEDLSDMKTKLTAASGADVYQGVSDGNQDLRELAERGQELLDRFVSSGKKDTALLREIAALYVQGAELDWESLYVGEFHRKVPLPLYPFDRTRCWLTIPDSQVSNPAPRVTATKSDRTAEPPKRVEDLQAEEIEGLVTGIFRQVMGDPQVAPESNFYELGGDSIIATAIINRWNERYSDNVSVRSLLEATTPAGLARHIAERFEPAFSLYETLQPASSAPSYPLSSGQRRLYVMQQFNRDSTAYNMPSAMQIDGAFDFERFQQALNRLVSRHESLRTSFQLVNGKPVQVIFPALAVPVESWREPFESVEAAMEAFVRPFDLSVAPLLRVACVKQGPEQHWVLFDMHHIISDGTSMAVFLQDWAYLYSGGAELPELPVQYKDFAVWQDRVQESEEFRAHEAYWLAQFAEPVVPLQLPTDFPRPPHFIYAGAKSVFTAGSDLSAALKKQGKDSGHTLYMILLTAYNILLSKYAGQHDIVIGTPVAGRVNRKLEQVIGIFVNTLPVRSRLDDTQTVLGLLRSVAQGVLDAMEHQAYPFDELVEQLGLQRDAARNPLFDALFAMQNMKRPDARLESLHARQLGYENPTATFDLALFAYEEEGILRFTFEYKTELFRQPTIQRMQEHFLSILRQIVERPNQMIGDIFLDLGMEQVAPLNYDSFDFSF